ncbi:hypothetical protein MBOU_58210 [Mycobacterium bourgelatii]|uniref:Uncharacterized protein n=2 Tax=Mycobacterium bourgelatii TaxID=1273442 RepID=A0A7I9YYG3_MYCBU|nr:hypothetical protein MBOU_58210 [Mycobacterium bourgelatii]
MSDALRRELRPQGVSVSVIQPVTVATPIWGKLRDSANSIVAATPTEIVEVYRRRFTAFLTANESRAYASKATAAEYADAVAHAVTARHPRIRYRVGAESWSSTVARRLMPDRLLDSVIEARTNRLIRAGSTQVAGRATGAVTPLTAGTPGG